MGRASSLVNQCLYWIIEPDPRLVFGSFHYECLLGYPLLTPLIVAPEPLFEHLCSSKSLTDGRISVGVARATPVGVAPEALEESWDSFECCIAFLGMSIFDFLLAEGR